MLASSPSPPRPGAPNGVILFCTGDLKVDDGQNPLMFSQVFHLLPDASGSNYWVCALVRGAFACVRHEHPPQYSDTHLYTRPLTRYRRSPTTSSASTTAKAARRTHTQLSGLAQPSTSSSGGARTAYPPAPTAPYPSRYCLYRRCHRSN